MKKGAYAHRMRTQWGTRFRETKKTTQCMYVFAGVCCFFQFFSSTRDISGGSTSWLAAVSPPSSRPCVKKYYGFLFLSSENKFPPAGRHCRVVELLLLSLLDRRGCCCGCVGVVVALTFFSRWKNSAAVAPARRCETTERACAAWRHGETRNGGAWLIWLLLCLLLSRCSLLRVCANEVVSTKPLDYNSCKLLLACGRAPPKTAHAGFLFQWRFRILQSTTLIIHMIQLTHTASSTRLERRAIQSKQKGPITMASHSIKHGTRTTNEQKA